RLSTFIRNLCVHPWMRVRHVCCRHPAAVALTLGSRGGANGMATGEADKRDNGGDSDGRSAVQGASNGTGTDGEADPRRGWRLMARAVRARRTGLILGVLTGLAWTGAKVSTGM